MLGVQPNQELNALIITDEAHMRQKEKERNERMMERQQQAAQLIQKMNQRCVFNPERNYKQVEYSVNNPEGGPTYVKQIN